VVITVGDQIYEMNSKPVRSSLYRLSIVDGKLVRERVSHIVVEPRAKGMLRFSIPRTATALVATVFTTDPKLRYVELRARVPARKKN